MARKSFMDAIKSQDLDGSAIVEQPVEVKKKKAGEKQGNVSAKKRYNIMLQPELHARLSDVAIGQKRTISDVLGQIVSEYFDTASQ